MTEELLHDRLAHWHLQRTAAVAAASVPSATPALTRLLTYERDRLATSLPAAAEDAVDAEAADVLRNLVELYRKRLPSTTESNELLRSAARAAGATKKR